MTIAPDLSRQTIRTVPLMGTMVRVEVVGTLATAHDRQATDTTIERAFDWFRQVEAVCSRFDAGSELRQACARVGEPVPVGEIAFEAVRFALAVADASGGAFDPAIGAVMAGRGFDRDYRTGAREELSLEPASYRDIQLDDTRRTLTVSRPLVIDLGAVAKGLAIDLAARELRAMANFAIDAGGDVYFGGTNADGEAWAVGVRHPRLHNTILASMRLSDAAVCTSGDYERATAAGHHLIDARDGESASGLASVTVVAPSAMVADALATAAFALGPEEGLSLLGRHGVQGLLVTTALDCIRTPEFPG